MERDFFKINFDKLKDLKREAREKAEQYSRIRTEMQSVNIRLSNLERFLEAEVHASADRELAKQLNEILEDRVPAEEPTVPAGDVSKTGFLASVLYKANLSGRGLNSKELFEAAKGEDDSFSGTLGYTNNVIYKLRQRGLVEKRETRYFLTEVGLEYFGQRLG